MVKNAKTDIKNKVQVAKSCIQQQVPENSITCID